MAHPAGRQNTKRKNATAQNDDHPADWLLWLAGRLCNDGPQELARASMEGVLRWSRLEAGLQPKIEADLADPMGQLLPALAHAIFQLRPLLMPLVTQFQLNRLTAAQASAFLQAAPDVTVPWKTLEGLNLAMSHFLEFYGARGREYAKALTEPMATAGRLKALEAEWAPEAEAERVWFGWPESGVPVPMQNASAWQAAGVPDPVQCRAMRRLALAVWFRQAEMAALKPTEDRYPHAVVPVAILKGMESWQTHRLEETGEGLVMRSPGGQADGGFPGLLPEVAARLVDNPGALAGLTARRIFRLLPRLAWKQAIEGKNPFNRLVFNGLQDLAEQLGIQNSKQIAMIRDVLVAGREWRRENLELPPLWEVWMPQWMARGRTVSQIRIDVGEGLCPGFVTPDSMRHRLRWLLPVLSLPDLRAVDRSRQVALEALQWALLMELRQSAAQGEVLGTGILLTEGQRLRAADRAGVSRSELEHALRGHNESVPWLGTFEAPGEAWLLDCGGERVRLSEAGAQQVLLQAAERADQNRSRYRGPEKEEP